MPKIVGSEGASKLIIYITCCGTPYAYMYSYIYIYVLLHIFSTVPFHVFKESAEWYFACFALPIYTNLYCFTQLFDSFQRRCHYIFAFYCKISTITHLLMSMKLVWHSSYGTVERLQSHFVCFPSQRDPGSNPQGYLCETRDSPVSVVSLHYSVRLILDYVFICL